MTKIHARKAMSRRHGLSAAILFGVAGCMTPASAHAQDAASDLDETATPDKRDSVEEIVITARRVSESLQTAPVSVGAVTSGRLESVGVQTLMDLDSLVPSLQFGSDSVRLQPFLGFRGVGDTSRNPGFDNRGGIYLDGVYLGRSSVTEFPAFDIERVEVLRGPQGTLFGKDSLTGVISITTAKPKFEDSYRMTLRAGSRNLLEGNGFVNAELSKHLAVRLSLSAQSQDGYYRNIFERTRLGGYTNVAGRLQFRYQPSSATTVDLTFDGARAEQNILFGGRPLSGPGAALGLPDYQLSLNRTPTKDRHIYGAALNIEHDLGSSLSLTSITAYRKSDSALLNIDFDISPLQQGGNKIYDEDRAFSQELRISSSFGGLFDFVAGAFYYSGRPEWQWELTLGPDHPVPALRNGTLTIDARVPQEIIAGFGRATLRPLSWVTVDAGLRYSHSSKKISYTQVPGILTAAGFANVPLYQDRFSENDVSPLLSVSIQPVKDINIYALYSTGSRPGGYNADLTSATNFTFGGIRFGGESVKNYEIGLKTELFDRRLRFNVAAYHMKFDDFQVSQLGSTDTVVGGVPTTVRFNSINNAAKVTSEGVEIDFDAVPFSGFNLSGGIGINRAKFDSFPNAFLVSPGPPPVFGNYDGNLLIEAPRFTASVTGTYKFDLSDRLESTLSLTYTRRGKTFSDPSNGPNFTQEASDLVNGRLGVGTLDNRFEVAVFARNLFKEKYVQAATTTGLGYAYQTLNEPRVVGIELTVRN